MKNKTVQRTINLNGLPISYEWIRKKVKNINLRVRGDGTVTVSSPHTVSEKQMELFLTEKANFLFHAIQVAEERKKRLPPPILFQENDIVFLFGEAKILHFSSDQHGKIIEDGQNLILSCEENREKAKKLLKEYAKNKLFDVITARCKQFFPLFPELREFPEIRFREMRSMWGNCRPQEGILTFNTRLACYPLPCIDYIVMHEFTHFLEPNHSAAFYTALAQKMPDWKTRKELLNTAQIQPFF